jgi:beta-lactam-binding protein with PASTA domain
MLASAGFTPDVTFRADDSVPVGRVIEQNPAGNQQKPKGSTVRIVVATAPSPSPTPTASETPSTSPTPLFP